MHNELYGTVPTKIVLTFIVQTKQYYHANLFVSVIMFLILIQ